MKTQIKGPDIGQVFKEVKKFCTEEGLIDDLKLSLRVPEKERFDSKSTLKTGLSVLHAVHCVIDKGRTDKFLEEINVTVDKNDTVLEAGLGTGILSFAAATKAKKVVGIEINKSVFDLANKIKNNLSKHLELKDIIKKIKFHRGNAITFKSKEKFTVLISENIYTGMFYEKQVQISNSLGKYLESKHKVIPSRMVSHISVAETKFPQNTYRDKELFVPLEHKKDLSYKILSKPTVYSDLDFTKKIDERFYFSSHISISKAGFINSIFITSDVYMPSGNIIRGKDTVFFNNDIIVSSKDCIEVKRNDVINVTLSYRSGDNPSDIELKIRKVK